MVASCVLYVPEAQGSLPLGPRIRYPGRTVRTASRGTTGYTTVRASGYRHTWSDLYSRDGQVPNPSPSSSSKPTLISTLTLTPNP